MSVNLVEHSGYARWQRTSFDDGNEAIPDYFNCPHWIFLFSSTPGSGAATDAKYESYSISQVR
ncbi:hypothetical protein PT974_04047 [Cladobotryum mycophilum]|uniref:Uncharacterized protein n=1 Tax=Cladobotryum mycophilum TaxID=491253 RepID=A0ABR0STZ2_9HYPO